MKQVMKQVRLCPVCSCQSVRSHLVRSWSRSLVSSVTAVLCVSDLLRMAQDVYIHPPSTVAARPLLALHVDSPPSLRAEDITSDKPPTADSAAQIPYISNDSRASEFLDTHSADSDFRRTLVLQALCNQRVNTKLIDFVCR